MTFTLGAGWRIAAVVERKYVATSGKFAEITLAYPDRGKTAKTKVCAFEPGLVERIAGLGAGETVQVTGGFWDAKLTNKDKSPVNVDGRDVYVTRLVIRSLTVEGETKGAASSRTPPDPPPPPDDLDKDDDLF